MTELNMERELGLIPGTKIRRPKMQGDIDGNAFSVMGHVKKALKRVGAPQSVVDEYIHKAMSGDYNNLLTVSMDYVDIEFPEHDDLEDDRREEDEYFDEEDVDRGLPE